MDDEIKMYVDLVKTQALALEKQSAVIEILNKKIDELTPKC